jgi:hypothetical protein
MRELIVGTKYHPQLVQPRQFMRQGRQDVTGEIENFQRVREIKNFGGKLLQAARQIKALASGQFAAA